MLRYARRPYSSLCCAALPPRGAIRSALGGRSMRYLLSLASAALISLAAAGPRGDAAKEDFAKLQGEWELASMEFDGEKTDKASVATYRRKIEGNKYAITYKQDGKSFTVKGTIIL